MLVTMLPANLLTVQAEENEAVEESADAEEIGTEKLVSSVDLDINQPYEGQEENWGSYASVYDSEGNFASYRV